MTQGAYSMDIREANIALISSIPDEDQKTIFSYLIQNFYNEDPFQPRTSNDIYAELNESRLCYEKGEFKDFDTAVEEIRKKYDL